jgi:beta-hydroxyacyl-ACP dehydratase FabZ
MNEPFFQGHFPAKPVMPGVLIIEALAQAGGILAAEIRGPEKQGEIIYFMGMDAVRFRKPVVPGDQLMLEARVLKMRSRVAKMAGRALVDGQLVAEAELMASFGNSD